MDYGFMGRNERAIHFLENWHELTKSEVNESLPHIWSTAEFPLRMASVEEWLEIFNFAGFCGDSEKLTKQVTIYRAAPPSFMRGLAWTDNIKVAKWYYNRNHLLGFKDVRLYKASVKPKHILGVFRNERAEDEILININEIKKIETLEEIIL